MRRELEGQLPRYRTVVAGTDGSPTAQEAVRHAAAISLAHGAVLHLVCAGPGKPRHILQQEMAGAPQEILHLIGPHEDLAAMLDQIATEVRQLGVEVICHPEISTNAAAAILAVAERQNADLIVVGNRGMHGITRVLGSVPNAISHSATCSVTIVRTT
jgi:nucleotide-binding universal stress UspA family protein